MLPEGRGTGQLDSAPVTWKGKLNRLLARAMGYRLRRASSTQPQGTATFLPTAGHRPLTEASERPMKRMPWAKRSAKGLRPYVPEVRADAVRTFREDYPDFRLARVVVVIAAYTEEECIGGVLEAIPREACGLPVETIVIDDGSADRTTEVALGQGVYVARLERNCGHGVALRLGYELAREHGAEYIVTLDADGQWDPVELPDVLAPVVDGEADFVIGSRVLGHAETDDSFRHAGVHVFATLVRVLTGTEVTDTSSGFRAMRSEVTGRVRQTQVQYQSSELLIGAIYHGYRIAERPVVMHKRTAGVSKKGHNLLYGFRYTRVILWTWWRERRGREHRARATRLALADATSHGSAPEASVDALEGSPDDRSEVRADARW
jgi:hypothetical protein